MGIGIAEHNRLCDTRGESGDGNVVLVWVVLLVVVLIRIMDFGFHFGDASNARNASEEH